jgi:hypothetical protein
MTPSRKFLVLFTVLSLVLGAGAAYGQSCSPGPTSFPLTYGAGQGAGSGTVVGTVTVWNDLTHLYVKYQVTTPGIYLNETQVSICDVEFAGRVAPGGTPYKNEHALGTTVYTYKIPLLGMQYDRECASCPQTHPPTPCTDNVQCNDILYILAHAALSNGETAYGGACAKPDTGAWYCQITWRICCDVPPPPPDGCDETAWGYFTGGECFIDITELKSNNWGWSIPIATAAPSTTTLTLYAGAGQCNTSKGTAVGTVAIAFDGAYANVTYAIDPAFQLVETHVWIGKTKLPLKNPKNPAAGFTAAPGKFPYKDGATVRIPATWGATFYVAAHAVVKVPCPEQ